MTVSRSLLAPAIKSRSKFFPTTYRTHVTNFRVSANLLDDLLSVSAMRNV